MDIKKELDTVQDCMFSDELLDTLLAAYEHEQEAHGTEEEEQEYRAAKETLPSILSGAQRAVLEKAEGLCRENLRYATRFSFSQGSCAGFRQLYEKNMPEDLFQVYVVDQIMKAPNVSNYTEYAMRRGEILAAFEALEESFCGEDLEHVISVNAAWDSRLYGVLRHAFYMGYRYALSVAASSGLIVDASYIAEKIRLTEYFMGFDDVGKEQ